MSCIVRRDHPRVRTRMTLARYASLPHVDLALFGVVDDTIDRALAREGRSRVVAVTVPHFSSVPLAVLETDCVATISSRLARRFAEWFPLRILAPPVRLDPLEIRQVWHRRSETDDGVTFLRRLIREAAAADR
jgi:DNA-binding transcriptional LysR family regulator